MNRKHVGSVVLVSAAFWLAGCDTQDSTAPAAAPAARVITPGLPETVRILAASRHIGPLASPVVRALRLRSGQASVPATAVG